MTREEYKKEIFGQHSSTKVYKSAKKYIASLEKQLKAKDKFIVELNDKLKQCRIRNDNLISELQAQEAKSCDRCKYDYDIDNFDSVDGKRLDSFRPNECYMCSRNMQDRFEPKEF